MNEVKAHPWVRSNGYIYWSDNIESSTVEIVKEFPSHRFYCFLMSDILKDLFHYRDYQRTPKSQIVLFSYVRYIEGFVSL